MTISTTRSICARSLRAALPAAMLLVLAAACDTTVSEPPTPIACSDYLDQPAEQAVDFVVRNETADWLYLPVTGCESVLHPRLFGDDAQLDLLLGPCTYSCGALQTSEQLDCGLACPAPFLIAIEPGGTYTLPWSGLVAEEQTMPAACYRGAPQASCRQRIAAPAQTYEVEVGVLAGLDCEGAPCACTPDAAGSCRIEVLPPEAPEEGHAIRVAFDHPSQSTVDITVAGPVACPDAVPIQGEPCGLEALTCDYVQTDACGHSVDPQAMCMDGTWTVIANSVACTLECPANEPTPGAPCVATTDGTHCPYGEDIDCPTLYACSQGSTWEDVSTDCQ